MSNIVYVGISLDGYIADRHGGLEWLNAVPNPDKDDCGFGAFVESVDALVMGRITFEVVDGFDVEWPYTKPVFVLSSTLKELPAKYAGKAHLLNASIEEIPALMAAKGYEKLYIDGGTVVQGFLRRDLIDELRLFRIPALLGGGSSLFADLPQHLEFKHVETKVHLGEIVESRYERKRVAVPKPKKNGGRRVPPFFRCSGKDKLFPS